MAKYRKKSVVVEAVQFDPTATPWPDYIKPWSSAIPPELNRMGRVRMKGPGVGLLPVSPGDWVVTDEDGDHVVFDDATFQRYYEPVVPENVRGSNE